MLAKIKTTIVAALLLGSASAAMAQSYDPSVGTGNIAPVPSQVAASQVYGGPLAAHAEVRMSTERSARTGSVLPFTAEEKALFDRIPIE